ncbi:glucosaminidase domain-containing protein [Mucilaginibacter segetis]|uniref:Glucosaminidase domain-containing protein n=1 Tax=Mucilaginibacter segetis TaxID=2793071 RepID=A0A934PUW3_9SPHI|nr:glucosaminidase domain-containing protein [Mucilaginibacter segetis]MBK0379982.1 glucosaminidase domain-containing protein [Mucilaginibacter segetis]
MKKLFTFLLLAIAFTATSQTSFGQTAAESYIDKFKDNAIRIMHETGIPASIVLGIAIHESASGKSAIAKHLNNQFGVKGSKSVVYYKNKKKVRSAYKRYDSVLDSFEDFARIMTERKQFSKLADKFTQYDYKAWALGIQRNGYASSKKWASQVLGIIEKYDLHDLDGNPANESQIAQNN